MVFGVLDRKHYNMMTRMLQFNDIFCNRKSWASDQEVQMIDKSNFGNDVCGHGYFGATVRPKKKEATVSKLTCSLKPWPQ